jgi:hypothetical protein
MNLYTIYFENRSWSALIYLYRPHESNLEIWDAKAKKPIDVKSEVFSAGINLDVDFRRNVIVC